MAIANRKPVNATANSKPKFVIPTGSTEVLLTRVMLSFPNLFEMSSFNEGAPTYNTKAAIDPSSPNVALLDNAIAVAAYGEWGEDYQKVLANLESQGKVCFRKHPYTKGDGTVYNGFEDMFYISANSKVRPGLFDRLRRPLVEADGHIYSGTIGNLKVNIWAQKGKWGNRINAGLMGFQWVEDGDSLGGGRAAGSEEFPEEELDSGEGEETGEDGSSLVG